VSSNNGLSEVNAIQEEGKFNVICQSCGKLLGINVDNKEKAFNLEERHTQNSSCTYTAIHLLRKQESNFNKTKGEIKDLI
jgi:hypothetical protein